MEGRVAPLEGLSALGKSWLQNLLTGSFGIGNLFGLAAVPLPGSPAEVRAFFQRRLRLYLAVSASLWLLVIAMLPAVSALVATPELKQFVLGWAFVGQILIFVALLALVLIVSRAPRSLGMLQLVDTLATLIQASGGASTMFGADARWRPELSAIIGVLACLAVRAAIVPTSAARSSALAKLSSIPILIGTYATYRGTSVHGYPSAYIMTATACVYCSVMVLTSSIISWVIYGLQRRVKEATELGQYELEHKIGEGAMGMVYRARHALLRRPTAIKLLHAHRAGTGALARFEREVRLTARLSHPNIVAVYDYGRTPDGVFYYAMEYLDGIDLQRIIEADGPQPPGRVVHIVRQVARALAEAHHIGLIHRDIKPANVLLSMRELEGDLAKVVDFGLVRDVSGAESQKLSAISDVMGTPLYMPPEQITNPGCLDERADLYALGAVAYFLLTGTPPFKGSTILEVCGQHLHTPPEPPSARLGHPLPPALERLVLELLKKNRDERPPNARALLESMQNLTDVAPWTEHDARVWWRDRSEAVRKQAARESQSPEGTLAIDLANRAERS